MHLSVGERKEWISLVPGEDPDTHRAISQDGEEFEFTDNNQESLETQIRRILVERDAAVSG